MGEEHGYAWPPDVIMGVWEELWARWCEELRELDRQALRAMKMDAPSFEQLKFFVTAPEGSGNPWLRVPNTFRLEDPMEYFKTDIISRHHRSLTRACWGSALRKIADNPDRPRAGAAGDPDDAARSGANGGGGDPPAVRSGNALHPRLFGDPVPREQGRALDHRPLHEGKYLCWDFATHCGCPRGDGCLHAHRGIKAALVNGIKQIRF